MFTGFNVWIDDMDKFNMYHDIGSDIYKQQIKIINTSLEKYINPDGSLNEMKIEDDWFPEVRAHVFLSHSHNDIDFVTSFAGWLYEKFKITAFIDSSVWGNSDDLLRSIDNKLCVSSRDDNGEIKTYSYALRNKSTSNVHMILYTALMKMMDNTECLMFINTPSSLKWSDLISNKAATSSPWIYGELLTSKLIRNRSRKAHRSLFQERDIKRFYESKDINFEYVFDKKHLIEISDYELERFEDRFYTDAFDALDNLYRQNKVDLERGIIND
ncbi:MAG: hypothetical protein NC313_03295 [Butyrivibrio sp.]|nr:hypothetical protein [Butyrivibrio sp.]